MIKQSIGLRYGAKKSKFEKSDSKLDTVREEIWIDCNFGRKSSAELDNINTQLNYKRDSSWKNHETSMYKFQLSRSIVFKYLACLTKVNLKNMKVFQLFVTFLVLFLSFKNEVSTVFPFGWSLLLSLHYDGRCRQKYSLSVVWALCACVGCVACCPAWVTWNKNNPPEIFHSIYQFLCPVLLL